MIWPHKQRLLELARREDFLIIEEDVYGDLQHASCTRLSALPHDDNARPGCSPRSSLMLRCQLEKPPPRCRDPNAPALRGNDTQRRSP